MTPRSGTKSPIGFDSAALLNLSKKSGNEDLLDYLKTLHEGPIILPAQVIQEFWNNQMSAVTDVAERVRHQFMQLEREVQQLDPDYDGLSRDLQRRLDEFRSNFGQVLAEGTRNQIVTLLQALTTTALQPEIDRTLLTGAAQQRKLSKTPPGFKDSGDGDFWVWADYLLGLRVAKRKHSALREGILVTDDKKSDWSTAGTTHPVLVAEAASIADVKFRTASVKQLASWIQEELDAGRPGDPGSVEA